MKKSTKLPFFHLYLTTEDYAHKFAGAEGALANQAKVLEEEISNRQRAVAIANQFSANNNLLKEENDKLSEAVANLNLLFNGQLIQIEALEAELAPYRAAKAAEEAKKEIANSKKLVKRVRAGIAKGKKA